MADQLHYPGMPRWVKVQGIFALGLVLLVMGMSTGLIHMERGDIGSAGGILQHAPPASGH